MGFQRKNDHHECPESNVDMEKELEIAEKKKYPSVHLPEQINFPSEFVVLQNAAYGFNPRYVDEAAQKGIFPMTVDFQDEQHFLLKLHYDRSLVFFDADAIPSNLKLAYSPKIFDETMISINKKLLSSSNINSKKPSLSVFMNRREDFADVFQMIRAQHGEQWMCHQLRLCFFHMLCHPDYFKTKIIVTAVRSISRLGVAEPSGNSPLPSEIHEGELVACEVGFLVGDIYSSATGGYCVNGCGLLQLRLTAHIMRECGCKFWDLGMVMDYKEKHLNVVEITRNQWIALVNSQRTTDLNILQKLETKYGKGVPVSTIIEKRKKVCSQLPSSITAE